MKIEFNNYWFGSSMKDGGCFPLHFLDIYADIHPSFRFFGITILNFGITLDFGRDHEIHL